ncbi:MAG: TolC family protein [Acidobacteria bacterium]|nr:TolC family protein [Acidobacteriota bacterium]
MTREAVKQALAVALCGSLLGAQEASIAPVRPSVTMLARPYKPVEVPPVRLANSGRLASLIRGGALYLTAQDAVALALENNIDLEVARYNPIMASWRLVRSEAGGALPGVTSAASQAGSVAAGQGVTGSQSAANVRGGGGAQTGGSSANASISQIGPVTQTLDPSIQETSTFSHTSTPQPNVVQSSVENLVGNTRAHTASIQQGFLSGGSVTLQFRDNYLNENSPTDLLNPSNATSLTLSAQHNLLRGFGVAVNARTITVSRMNVTGSELSFKLQVINLAARVLNSYYQLSSSFDDLKAKQTTAEVADTFVANVKRQIDLGTVAPPELVSAQSQAVTSRQAVVDAEASLRQQELQLKNLISRNGVADPALNAARIVPVDKVAMPSKDDLPSIDEMVKQARANRADLASARLSLEESQISLLGTRNNVLPTLTAFGAASTAGLAGVARTVRSSSGSVSTPDPYFVGGLGDALGQTFRRNFPTERIGAFYQGAFRNRQAQADQAIDELSLRQSQLTAQKDVNQVEVDVRNYVIQLEQARARYEAAVKKTALQQELFDAEQKKYSLGTSTPYNVIQQQRDLVVAQSAEKTALVSYSTARISLDRTLGRTLEANGVTIAEATAGKVSR